MHSGRSALIRRLALFSIAAGAIWVAALAVGLLAVHGRPGDLAVRLVNRLRQLPGGAMPVLPGSGSTAEAGGR